MKATDKIDKDYPAVRHALYISHNKKCAIKREKINLSDLHIDHIIPERLAKNPTDLKNYLKLVGKPEDFELNSILNYIPVSSKINLDKGGHTLEPEYARFLLDKASRLANTVINEIKNYKENNKMGKTIEELRAFSYFGKINAEEVHDILSNDSTPFPEQKETLKSDYGRNIYPK